MPWLGVLVCGDYLSPAEIPVIGRGGSAEAYLETLEHLRPLIHTAESVIPGHGGPLGSDGALALLEEDVRYLEALAREGAKARLPEGRRATAQRRIHAENVALSRRS